MKCQEDSLTIEPINIQKDGSDNKVWRHWQPIVSGLDEGVKGSGNKTDALRIKGIAK